MFFSISMFTISVGILGFMMPFIMKWKGEVPKEKREEIDERIKEARKWLFVSVFVFFFMMILAFESSTHVQGACMTNIENCEGLVGPLSVISSEAKTILFIPIEVSIAILYLISFFGIIYIARLLWLLVEITDIISKSK